LGGGTGTGAIVALSEELRKRFADSPVPRLVIGVVTLPFEVETARMEIAKKGLDNLKKSCDTVVVIDNDRLVKIAGNLPFREALGVANTTIGKFIKGITESITTASLINLDYADLRAIMQGAGLASIGVGEGTGEGRVEQAVERAINGRLLDIEDVTKAWGLLIKRGAQKTQSFSSGMNGLGLKNRVLKNCLGCSLAVQMPEMRANLQ